MRAIKVVSSTTVAVTLNDGRVIVYSPHNVGLATSVGRENPDKFGRMVVEAAVREEQDTAALRRAVLAAAEVYDDTWAPDRRNS